MLWMPLRCMFKAEVKNQLDRKIKIMRSNRGSKYFGRNDESGRNPDTFARFLEQEGISLHNIQYLLRHIKMALQIGLTKS